MEIIKPINKNLNKIIDFLNSGEVVVYPTDTVYGFLALAENKEAINKIYKIKKRPKNKSLPIFVKDIKMAKTLAEINKDQEKILKKYWPGKYTFVLKPCEIGSQTVALRIPKYVFLNKLLKKINKPLVQTSVNISGQEPLIKAGDIIEKFGKIKDLLFIDAGNLPKKGSSRIIDLTSKALTILR